MRVIGNVLLTSFNRALRAAVLASVSLLPSVCLSAEGAVFINVENDTIVMAPAIDLEGTACPDGAAVTAELNHLTFDGQRSGDHWAVRHIGLSPGANLIEVHCAGHTASLLVIRGGDALARRPAQQVTFIWRPGVDEVFRQIAQDTLDQSLTDEQLATFVIAVRSRIVEVFQNAYRGVADIELVPSDGPNVHTITMYSIHDSAYGSSPFDCGNRTPKQNTEIHVGTFQSQMTGNFAGWAPMKRSDPLDVRIEDLAQAVGRTAAHEFGHSLGLVGQLGDRACAWMDGCDKGHNCAAMSARFQASDRFLNGWHIMDPGLTTLFNARLAEPDEAVRSPTRRPSFFEAFSRSYLRLIHPVQP